MSYTKTTVLKAVDETITKWELAYKELGRKRKSGALHRLGDTVCPLCKLYEACNECIVPTMFGAACEDLGVYKDVWDWEQPSDITCAQLQERVTAFLEALKQLRSSVEAWDEEEDKLQVSSVEF